MRRQRQGWALATGMLLAGSVTGPVFAQQTPESAAPRRSLLRPTVAPAPSTPATPADEVIPTAHREVTTRFAAPSKATKATPVRSTRKQDAAPLPPAMAGAEMGGEVGLSAPMPAAATGCTTCAAGASGGQQYATSSHGTQGPGLWNRLKYKYNNYWKPGLQESHWGYPEEFCEKPLGYHVYSHARTQVANGEAARMMLYEYDFVEGSAELTPRGQQQLGKIAYMLPRNFFPVLIEPTNIDPTLADKRRAKVLETLQASNFPIPDERVVVARPIAAGLDGYQGQGLAETMLEIMAQGGAQEYPSVIGISSQIGNLGQ